MVKRSFLGLALLLQSGCLSIFDGECGSESRTIEVRGAFHEGATVLVDVRVELSETRAGPGGLLFARISGAPGTRGAPFRDNVVDVRLMDAVSGGLLHHFPIFSPPVTTDDIIGATYSSPFDRQAVRLVLLDGNAALEMESYVPGRELLSVPLPTVHVSEWDRPSCS
jgi:hypothetical protein